MQLTLNHLSEQVKIYCVQSRPDLMGGVRQERVLQRKAGAWVSPQFKQKGDARYYLGLRYQSDIYHIRYFGWRRHLLKVVSLPQVDAKERWVIFTAQDSGEPYDRG